MKKLFAAFCKSGSGATAIEYGLIALSIAIVIIAAVASIGTNVGDIFVAVNSGFS